MIRGLKESGKRRWERSQGGRQGPGGWGRGSIFLGVMGSCRGFQAGGHILVYVSKKITLAVTLPEGMWGDQVGGCYRGDGGAAGGAAEVLDGGGGGEAMGF